MLTLQVHEKEIEITTSEEFVRGTVGRTCQIDLDEFWADYSNTIVFKRCGSKPINILVDKLSNTLTIPFEVMAESGTFRIGVFGVAEDKVLPTLWSDEIKVRYGTDTYGTEPAEYTPDEIEQLKATKQDKLTAGDNITIDGNNVISATVPKITVDDTLSDTSTNPVQNSVITTALYGRQILFADVSEVSKFVSGTVVERIKELIFTDNKGGSDKLPIDSVRFYNSSNKPVILHGISAGELDTDAANISQLNTKQDKFADVIDSNADREIDLKDVNGNTVGQIIIQNDGIFITNIKNPTLSSQSDYAVNKGFVENAIATQVSSVYKAKGSIPNISDLPTPSKNTEGFVYNIESEFTTNSNFVEGVGKTYPAGTNVVIVNTEGTTYKYDVLAGMVDLTNYVTKTDLNNYYTKSQTYTKTEVDNKISAEIGNINSILATMFNDVSTQSDEETTDEGAIE